MKARILITACVMLLTGGLLAQNNIGIGISDPQYPLHIYKNSSNHVYLSFGNVTTGALIGDGVLIGLDPNEDFRIHSYENNNFRFHINNSEKMRLTNLGHLGIGTSSPNELLHIWDATEAAVKIESDHNGFSSLKLVEPLGLGFEYKYATSTNDLTLWSRTILANQAVATWLDSGHFGIGTTSPSARLEVDHSGTGDIMLLRSLGTNRMRVLYGGDVAIDSTTFYVDQSANRIGFGTTSPSGRLHLTGIESDQTALMLENNSTGNPGIRFRLNGLTKFMMGVDRTDTKFKITETTSLGSQVRLELDEPGNLSIKGDYGYLTPKTHILHLHPSDFMAIGSNPDDFVLWAIGCRILTGPGSLEFDGSASLRLPQGAQVTNIGLYYEDASATEGIAYARANITRRTITGPLISSNAGQVLVSTTSAYSDPDMQVETTSISPLTIDNDTYRYDVKIIWEVDLEDTYVRFWGIHILYELEELIGF